MEMLAERLILGAIVLLTYMVVSGAITFCYIERWSRVKNIPLLETLVGTFVFVIIGPLFILWEAGRRRIPKPPQPS